MQEAILKLAQAWLAVQRLTGVVAQVDVSIEWPALEGKDQAAHTAKVKLATDNGWITDETGLRLLDLVDDPAAEVEAAKQAAQTDESRMQAEIDAQLSAMRMQSAMDSSSDPMDSEDPIDGEGAVNG